MAALPRSEISFRRSGSSGLVWDDKLLSTQLNETLSKSEKTETKNQEITTETSSAAVGLKIERSRSNGGFRTGKVSPAVEPPSPKVSACGFCSAFGKSQGKTRRQKKGGKRVM